MTRLAILRKNDYQEIRVGDPATLGRGWRASFTVQFPDAPERNDDLLTDIHADNWKIVEPGDYLAIAQIYFSVRTYDPFPWTVNANLTYVDNGGGDGGGVRAAAPAQYYNGREPAQRTRDATMAYTVSFNFAGLRTITDVTDQRLEAPQTELQFAIDKAIGMTVSAPLFYPVSNAQNGDLIVQAEAGSSITLVKLDDGDGASAPAGKLLAGEQRHGRR